MQTLSYRHVYLAPHLDDAVLSCGGLIHRQVQAGEPVLAITVFAATPNHRMLSDFATSLHNTWGLGQDPVAGRRIEDQLALAFLGAEYRHLEHMDCIYRRAQDEGGWLYPKRDDILGDVHPAERDYGRVLARELRPALPPQAEPRCTLLSALGIMLITRSCARLPSSYAKKGTTCASSRTTRTQGARENWKAPCVKPRVATGPRS